MVAGFNSEGVTNVGRQSRASNVAPLGKWFSKVILILFSPFILPVALTWYKVQHHWAARTLCKHFSLTLLLGPSQPPEETREGAVVISLCLDEHLLGAGKQAICPRSPPSRRPRLPPPLLGQHSYSKIIFLGHGQPQQAPHLSLVMLPCPAGDGDASPTDPPTLLGHVHTQWL